MTEQRWRVECEIVKANLPNFYPFECSFGGGRRIYIGFKGLHEKRGKQYEIKVIAPKDTYPLLAPRVFITPTIDRGYLEADGAVSIFKEWIPTRDTFANMTLIGIQYINENMEGLWKSI